MRIIKHLSEVSHNYDALLVDLWGCLHNGVKAFPDAVAALQAYRAGGGAVALLTNAPRPWTDVQRQIERFGVPGDAWDVIVTSGDSARAALFRGAVGQRVWFMGNERIDMGFFDPPDFMDAPLEITRVALDEAEGIVCTGPFDALAPVEDVKPELMLAKQRGLKLMCANPDLVVDRGETREFCAGSVAKLYEELGGESLYFGKPHPPIYDLSRRRLAARLGRSVDDSRILAIGDGILTDIPGAVGEDIDCIFITGGLAASETKTTFQPDPSALAEYIAQQAVEPTFAMGFLR